jgi:hypothetical protein
MWPLKDHKVGESVVKFKPAKGIWSGRLEISCVQIVGSKDPNLLQMSCAQSFARKIAFYI